MLEYLYVTNYILLLFSTLHTYKNMFFLDNAPNYLVGGCIIQKRKYTISKPSFHRMDMLFWSITSCNRDSIVIQIASQYIKTLPYIWHATMVI